VILAQRAGRHANYWCLIIIIIVIVRADVVEEGTGKRAALDGIRAAGKTGTTNAYRDAWFVAFTGNFVCGVWFGNDDYKTMNQMTGGSLPAMTWHEIMAYAHEGVELKPILGINGQVARAGVGESRREGGSEGSRPSLLTRRGTEVLLRVERLLDDATRALAAEYESRKMTDAAPGSDTLTSRSVSGQAQ
jgi:penicillin-binding protein 1A